MSKEEIMYVVGDVIETTKGKGKIIFRDRPSPESPIITLEGEWVYMIEDDNGKTSNLVITSISRFPICSSAQ